MPRKHLVIPDCQVKPGVDISHMRWIGQYIMDKRPDVVICIGDFADMPSLSTHDRGQRSAALRAYSEDVASVHKAMTALLAPLKAYNAKQRGKARYKPRLVMTLGNHEDRIRRAVEEDSRLHGTIHVNDLKYKEFGWEVHDFLKPAVVDGVAYCLASDHKVLTADLRYVPLKDIVVGDTLIGFDENIQSGETHRKYRTTVVERHDLDTAELFEVALDDGKTFRATADHRWLIRHPNQGLGWLRTDQLQRNFRFPRLMPEWQMDQSREAGWVAGIFDGEGHLSRPNTAQGGIQIGVAQNPGIILDRIGSSLTEFGVEHKSKKGDHDCVSTRVLGQSGKKLEFLGRIRPERLIAKFKPEMLGRVQAMNGDSRIVSIRSIGKGEIVKIQTTTATMVVEGYPHHNCHYFTSGVMGRPVSSARALVKARHASAVMGHVQDTDVYMKDARVDGKGITGVFCGTAYLHSESYLGAQGNSQRRQIVLLHDVDDGEFDLCFVSLRFLKDKYGHLHKGRLVA